MTAQLLAAFPGLRMIATDYDTDMVATARQTLAPFGDRASAQHPAAAALPFEDDRFDLVLSAAMLHHVIAWDKALAEAVRVLRPGGRLVGYDLLDTAPIRLLHFGGKHDTSMLRRGQMETQLSNLPVTGAHKVGCRRPGDQIRSQQSCLMPDRPSGTYPVTPRGAPGLTPAPWRAEPSSSTQISAFTTQEEP